MDFDKKCIACCRELITALPDEERKDYDILLGHDDTHYIDELHEGLTHLAVACIELAVLFSEFEKEQNHRIVVRRMTLGYLFEVYTSIWDWIGKPLIEICNEKGEDLTEYHNRKKTLESDFSKHIPLLKRVRDGSFHVRDTGDKDKVNLVTKLLFRNKIPQILRRSLYEYGYDLNVITFKKGIYGCYPGIGGFGAIHPDGRVNPMKDYYLEGTSVIITPDNVAE